MDGQLAIWVIASNANKRAEIRQVFAKARLGNCVELFESNRDLLGALQSRDRIRQTLLLVELNDETLPLGPIVKAASCDGSPARIIAVIQAGDEALLDRAYDAGVTTYLLDGFTFPEFIERARMLGIHLVLGRMN